MPFTLKPPPPPDPRVQRFNPDGTPTRAQLEYEKLMAEWLRKLAAAIP